MSQEKRSFYATPDAIASNVRSKTVIPLALTFFSVGFSCKVAYKLLFGE